MLAMTEKKPLTMTERGNACNDGKKSLAMTKEANARNDGKRKCSQ